MKLHQRILIGLGCLTLTVLTFDLVAPQRAYAVVATLVHVANTPSDPVPVGDIAAQQAYAASCTSNLTFPDNINECFMTVPAGKRFIIQTVSMHAVLDSGVTVAHGAMVTFNGPAANIVWLGMPLSAPDPAGYYESQSTQEVHAYADGNSNVECSALFRSDTKQNQFNCSVFGYLVNQP